MRSKKIWIQISALITYLPSHIYYFKELKEIKIKNVISKQPLSLIYLSALFDFCR